MLCAYFLKNFLRIAYLSDARFFLKKNYELRISYNFFHVLRISRYQCISWQYSLFDIYLLKVKGPYPNYCLNEASARNGHIRVNQSLYRRYTDEPMKRQYINHNLETVLLCEVKGPYPNYCLNGASARNGHIRVNQSLYRWYADEPMKRQYINHNLETVPTVWLWHFSILQPSRHARSALGQFRNLIMKSHTHLLVLRYRLMKFFDIVAVWLQRVLCQCTVQGRPRNLIMKLP